MWGFREKAPQVKLRMVSGESPCLVDLSGVDKAGPYFTTYFRLKGQGGSLVPPHTR
jgi:hypothetical protein